MRREYNAPLSGFGFPDGGNSHHFVVVIPEQFQDPVRIVEYYGDLAPPGFEQIERCHLAWVLWEAISDELRSAFNQRLKAEGHSTSQWHVGTNCVQLLLGKELLVLAWAVELTDCAHIAAALQNWHRLRPEERWWLCTMTAAATGSVRDVGGGWRKALYYALVEGVFH